MATHRSRSFSRNFLLLLVVGVGVMFVYMTRMFFVPVLLAAIFATLFYPFYTWVRDRLGGRRGIASAVCCIVLLIGLLVPVYLLADLLAREVIDFYSSVEDDIQEFMALGQEGILGQVSQWLGPWGDRLPLADVDWAQTLQEGARTASTWAARLINTTSRGTFQVLLNLFLVLFTLFYFFRDGSRIALRFKELLPLAEEDKMAIAQRFASVSRATVKGTLVIALIQGGLGGLVLWITGVSSPLLWGMVMVILSIIPVIGSWLVMYPAAAIQLLSGNVWQGLVIFLATVIVILQIDNVLRPRLVGHESGMHDLMVLFSTLGGIAVFGPMGFIVGPVIAALFLSLLDIYSAEFQDSLHRSNREEGGGSKGPPVKPGRPGPPAPSAPAEKGTLASPAPATPVGEGPTTGQATGEATGKAGPPEQADPASA